MKRVKKKKGGGDCDVIYFSGKIKKRSITHYVRTLQVKKDRHADRQQQRPPVNQHTRGPPMPSGPGALCLVSVPRSNVSVCSW
jgi:hypothetical protein